MKRDVIQLLKKKEKEDIDFTPMHQQFVNP